MGRIKQIDVITLTINDCDYSYNIKDNKLMSCWCDCPIEFDVNLARSLVTYANFINECLKKDNFIIEKKEQRK